MRGRGLELDRCRNFFMDAVYDFVLAWAVAGAEELNVDLLLDEVGEAPTQWGKTGVVGLEEDAVVWVLDPHGEVLDVGGPWDEGEGEEGEEGCVVSDEPVESVTGGIAGGSSLGGRVCSRAAT